MSRIDTPLHCSHRPVLLTVGTLFSSLLVSQEFWHDRIARRDDVVVTRRGVLQYLMGALDVSSVVTWRGGSNFLMGLLGEGSASTVLKLMMGSRSSRGEAF